MRALSPEASASSGGGNCFNVGTCHNLSKKEAGQWAVKTRNTRKRCTNKPMTG